MGVSKESEGREKVNMTIKTLEIQRFKGIRHLLLELDGHNAAISGRNGTGKTSVCDAFLWLLFGKDSAGNKPDVKPRNTLGERMEGMESDVRAVLTVDGKEITLRRQWHEVWSKDTDSGERVYARDETLCWIDEVPVKLEKEYAPYVLGLVGGDEGTFKLLTDLGAFMRLNWADRRRELVKIAGGEPDTELQAKPEYADVATVLRGASPEDAKKRLLDQRRTLETELKTLPARIDELERMKRPLTQADVDAANAALDSLQAETDLIDAELTASTAALENTNAMYARKRALETRRTDIERDLRKPLQAAISTAEGKLGIARRAKAALETDKLMLTDDLRRHNTALAQLQDNRKTKLDEWHDWNDRVYTAPDLSTTCQTCGQPLPPSMVDEAAKNNRDQFQHARHAFLNDITNEGKRLAERIALEEKYIADIGDKLEAVEKNLSLPDGIAELEAEIERLSKATPRAENNPDWQAVMAELDSVDAEITALGKDTRRDELNARKAAIVQEREPHSKTLSSVELNGNVQARIDVLTEDKRKVGTQIAAVEGQIDLLSRYVRARCGVLEESINRLFHSIRWKLFDFAKNGSLIDCCDATVDGIAYGLASLNTGACVNADIEIIHVLSDAYGVTVPCFVDNAERVNQIGFSGGQRILLQVTDDPELTIMKEE